LAVPREELREIVRWLPRVLELIEAEDGRDRAWAARSFAEVRERNVDCCIARDAERSVDLEDVCPIDDLGCTPRARFGRLARESVCGTDRPVRLRPWASSDLMDARSDAARRASGWPERRPDDPAGDASSPRRPLAVASRRVLLLRRMVSRFRAVGSATCRFRESEGTVLASGRCVVKSAVRERWRNRSRRSSRYSFDPFDVLIAWRSSMPRR